MIRAFISIPVPSKIIAVYQKTIQSTFDESNIKLQPEEKAHLTIQFLGNITAEQASRTLKILRTAAQINKPPKIWFVKIALLPKGKPHSVVLEITKTDQLIILQKQIRDKLMASGIGQTERRGYYPHITLAKIKNIAGLGEPIASTKELFTATSINLMQSKISKNGSRFSVLGSYRFKNE